MTVGIMQGRLVPPHEGRIQSFPRERWRDEFPLAAAADLDAIEWIFDVFGLEANPIAADAGLEDVNALSARTGVGVRSVCADYFMDAPLHRGPPAGPPRGTVPGAAATQGLATRPGRGCGGLWGEQVGECGNRQKRR